jgi:hypothetical protein
MLLVAIRHVMLELMINRIFDPIIQIFSRPTIPPFVLVGAVMPFIKVQSINVRRVYTRCMITDIDHLNGFITFTHMSTVFEILPGNESNVFECSRKLKCCHVSEMEFNIG